MKTRNRSKIQRRYTRKGGSAAAEEAFIEIDIKESRSWDPMVFANKTIEQMIKKNPEYLHDYRKDYIDRIKKLTLHAVNLYYTSQLLLETDGFSSEREMVGIDRDKVVSDYVESKKEYLKNPGVVAALGTFTKEDVSDGTFIPVTSKRKIELKRDKGNAVLMHEQQVSGYLRSFQTLSEIRSILLEDEVKDKALKTVCDHVKKNVGEFGTQALNINHKFLTRMEPIMKKTVCFRYGMIAGGVFYDLLQTDTETTDLDRRLESMDVDMLISNIYVIDFTQKLMIGVKLMKLEDGRVPSLISKSIPTTIKSRGFALGLESASRPFLRELTSSYLQKFLKAKMRTLDIDIDTLDHINSARNRSSLPVSHIQEMFGNYKAGNEIIKEFHDKITFSSEMTKMMRALHIKLDKIFETERELVNYSHLTPNNHEAMNAHYRSLLKREAELLELGIILLHMKRSKPQNIGHTRTQRRSRRSLGLEPNKGMPVTENKQVTRMLGAEEPDSPKNLEDAQRQLEDDEKAAVLAQRQLEYAQRQLEDAQKEAVIAQKRIEDGKERIRLLREGIVENDKE